MKIKKKNEQLSVFSEQSNVQLLHNHHNENIHGTNGMNHIHMIEPHAKEYALQETKFSLA